MPCIVVCTAVVSPWIIDIDHVLSAADSVVVATRLVQGLAVIVDCVDGPAMREPLGDCKRGDLSVGDANALPVDD